MESSFSRSAVRLLELSTNQTSALSKLFRPNAWLDEHDKCRQSFWVCTKVKQKKGSFDFPKNRSGEINFPNGFDEDTFLSLFPIVSMMITEMGEREREREKAWKHLKIRSAGTEYRMSQK